MTIRTLDQLERDCQEAAVSLSRLGNMSIWTPLLIGQTRTLIYLLLSLLTRIRGSCCENCRGVLGPHLQVAEDFARALDDEALDAARDRIAKESACR